MAEQAEASRDLELPTGTRKDVASINSSLATSIALWLKKHGKAIRPKLSSEQKQQLKECFELMDQDGSGAIDADELGAAFKLLGIHMKKAELGELLNEVDHDGSGEVEYLEFLEIMTTTLQRLAEEREADETQGEGQVPFALMATAYRRKRLMEGIISGDKEVMNQIAQLSEKQTADALAVSQAAAASRAGDAAGDRKSALTAITKRSVERLKALCVDQELLQSLTPDERRLLSQVAERAGLGSPAPVHRTGSPGSPARPVGHGAAAGEAIASGLVGKHYSRSPGHRQLMEVPQRLDLHFSRPTIKLNATGGGLPRPAQH
ncbi:hypothetical protein QJQ45_028828 [Haematococcus lacustris]|nr:hypothetical protein QJQ45_028828 [Haematococcus lacustris]